MKSIFKFIDYRKFLLHYYEERKQNSRCFSHRFFANRVGINSPSFLKQVIDGKRNLTRSSIEKFCGALELSPKESVYFRQLVFFNQAKTPLEKQEYYTSLISMVSGVKETVLNVDQYNYFANWYIPVIRELICLYDFKNNYKIIASAVEPQILPSEAKKAVLQLLRLKLVERMPDGTYREANTAVTADSTVASLAVRSFMKTMIDHSKNALDRVPKHERHISGLTIGVSPATYAILDEEIVAFKNRVKAIVNKDETSIRVYQMNIAFFPVSVDRPNLDDQERDSQ
jgi:uncharacterized protein (TIGR02147 family)